MKTFTISVCALLIGCCILASVYEAISAPTTIRKAVRLVNTIRGKYVRAQSAVDIIRATGKSAGNYHSTTTNSDKTLTKLKKCISLHINVFNFCRFWH